MLSSRSLGLLLWMMALMPMWAHAQDFEFKPPASADDASASGIMRDLAERVLPVYHDADIERYMATLSMLQLVAGNYAAANDTRQSLLERRQSMDAGKPVGRGVLFDLYANARAVEAGGGTAFGPAFTQSFRDMVPKLGDLDAYTVTTWLRTPLTAFRDPVQKAFDHLRSKTAISLPEALDLIRTYLSFEAYRSFGPLANALGTEDDARRYVVEENITIRTSAGAKLYARVVRPKNLPKPLPALLEFTILATQDDAKASAAHGYVGVVAYVRGKNIAPVSSKDKHRHADPRIVIPFEHDGADARGVIAWIARQPWSDGRVGMIGAGYSGFAAWSVAKHLPAALKAIATSDSMAPGIDFPTEGRVFKNSALRWALTESQNADTIDAAGQTMSGDARWSALDQAWYKSGKAYRSLDRLAKPRNPIFRTWLTHPSYDRYWQKMIPVGKQFAKVGIPVLSTTGYYANGEVGALYYYAQHARYQPNADHTLVIGPYDDATRQERPPSILRGYAVDTVAQVDLKELRYQWLDSIFKGSARPALLKDHVNYQLMGSNEWRHAPSLAAMANGQLKFYLAAAKSGDRHRLLPAPAANDTFVEQTIKLADRSDALRSAPADIVGKSLAVSHGITFVSEPLQQSMEFNGLLSGQLDFIINKQDVDLNVTVYELLASGEYLQLADPYEFRASYVDDRINRKLLKAGERQLLAFTSEQMTSRKLQVGSRVVLVLGVNKRPDREINYGSGKNVSEESIADAGAALKLRWYASSYIEIPVLR